MLCLPLTWMLIHQNVVGIYLLGVLQPPPGGDGSPSPGSLAGVELLMIVCIHIYNTFERA